jgi:GNAT superfamily N-acetyltransferase
MHAIGEMSALSWTRGDLRVSTDPSLLDIDAIHAFLTSSYWAAGIPRDVVERSIRHSLPFGVFEGGTQIGFARVVSDHATFAYVADVFILESHRGRGLGRWVMECIKAHPELQGLRRWVLGTRDAHGLYRRVGFRPLGDPAIYMEILDGEVYSRHEALPG